MDQAYEAIVKSKKSALIYAATSLMMTERTAAYAVPVPETSPQQFVAVGTPEQIAELLPEAGIKPARRKDDQRPIDPLVFDDEPTPAATSGDAYAEYVKSATDRGVLPCSRKEFDIARIERAAVSAATKPTTDAIATLRAYWEHGNWNEASAESCGSEISDALTAVIWGAATKPAGVPGEPIGTVIDHDRIAGESTIDVFLDIGDDVYDAPIAAPAEQADKVRDEALEEAARVCDAQGSEPECPERAAYCAEAIRALKTTKG